MSKEDLLNEIQECEFCINGLSGLMKEMYGAKDTAIKKNALIKEYTKRIEKAQKELDKLESGSHE